jgi:hypothetical protein
MSDNFWEDAPLVTPKAELQANFWDEAPVIAQKPKTSNVDLNNLVANQPFGSVGPEIPPLLERQPYVNRWPETSYLRSPEQGYTGVLNDGQEVIISVDGKTNQLATWNGKTGKFETPYSQTESIGPAYNPSTGIGMGSMPYMPPVRTVNKVAEISPDAVLGYANAADKIETAKIAFGRSVIPTASGFAGFGGGAALGTLLAPETGGLSLAIPLLMGAGGGFFSGMGGQALQDKMFPIDKEQQLALDSNPKTAGVASFAPAFIASPASPKTYMGLASSAPGVASASARQLGANAALMGALGTGNEVGANLMAGKPAFDNVGLGSVLHHAGTGLLLGHPNALGRAMEFPGRFPVNMAAKPFGKGAYADPRSISELEAAAQAQEQAQQPTPAAPATPARPEGSVPPRPIYDSRFHGRGQAGIDEYTAAWKAWDAQYKDTHLHDGTPKAAPAPVAEAPKAMPAPAEPTPSEPVAEAPAPKEAPAPAAEQPKPTILDIEVANKNEEIRFIKGELQRRQAELDADAREGRKNPETARKVARLKTRLEDAEDSLESLKNRNSPRSELPAPKQEPSSDDVLAAKKRELDAVTRQLEAAHRRGDEELIADLEIEHERVSDEYEAARMTSEQNRAPVEMPAAPAPAQVPAPQASQKPTTPVQPEAAKPVQPEPAKAKPEPQGVKDARAQLAKLEASGNADGNQARARRKYIREWERANGLPYSVELEAPKPKKEAKPATVETPPPAEAPVAEAPAPVEAPKPTAEAPAPVEAPKPASVEPTKEAPVAEAPKKPAKEAPVVTEQTPEPAKETPKKESNPKADEAQKARDIINGLEQQIVKAEKSGRGDSPQAKKQREALERAKEKLAELEGNKTEPAVEPANRKPVDEGTKPKSHNKTFVERILNRFNQSGVSEAEKGKLRTAFKSLINENPSLLFHGDYQDAATALGVKLPKGQKGSSFNTVGRREDGHSEYKTSPFEDAPNLVDDPQYRREAADANSDLKDMHPSHTVFPAPNKSSKPITREGYLGATEETAPKEQPKPAAKAPKEDNASVPSDPDATIGAVERIAGVKLSKGAREELGIRAEEGLQPDFIDEGGIKSIKDHLGDLVERLDATIDASRSDPIDGPKARKDANEAKRAIEKAIAKIEAEQPAVPQEATNARAVEATASEAPKAEPVEAPKDTTTAQKQVDAINDKLAELERQKNGETPEAEALRQQRDKLQETIDAQTPPSADVRGAAEKWADDTIAQSRKRLNSGIDPELVAAYAVKGAIKFGRTLKDFTEFSREMVNEFGDGIKPHLKAIFDKAQDPNLAKDYISQQEARAAAGKTEPNLQKEAAAMAQERSKERQQAQEMAQGQKPELSAGGQTWRSVVDHPIVAYFKSLSMRMRTVADLNPQSQTAQKVVNDFSVIPGTKETGPDYNTTSANQRNVFFNKFTQALGPVLNEIRRMSPEQRAKFNDLFIKAVEGRLPRDVGGETGKAVLRVREVMKELHKYGIDAGLEMGEVSKYFPRNIDADAVQANRTAFEEAAAKAYERQWERQQKEALEGQTEFGFADEQTQRPDFKEMARKWADAIILGHEGLDFERGIFEEGNPATKEKFQKQREFTAEEAAEFDAFRDKDFESVLTRHVGDAVRRAEIAKRLGADGNGWAKLASQMSKEGVSPEHIAELKQTIQSNLGISADRLGNKTAASLDLYNLVTTSAYLKATGLLNFGEVASLGIREGDPLQGAKAIFSNAARVRNVLTRLSPAETKAVKTEIERIYGKGHDLASALAIELGVTQINHGLGSISSGYHLDGGSDRTGGVRRLSDNVYRMYGIHATETAKQETSLKHGMQFIDKSIQFLEGTSNLQRIFKSVGKDVRADTLAKDRLMELGITEERLDGLVKFAKELRGIDGDAQLKKIMADDVNAAEYRKALAMFNRQSSVRANKSSRTEVANDSAFGKLLFQFSTFTNEWSAQHGRYMAETAKKVFKNPGDRYTPTERLLAAGSAPAFAVSMAAMAGVKALINTLTGFNYEDGKVPAWVKSASDAFVYTGILGPTELLYKAAIREQLPLGVLGDWLKNGIQTYGRLKENPDSDAAQRSAAKMGYRSAFVPATVSGLAAASKAADFIPNPVLKGVTKLGAVGLSQVVANNRVENATATAIAGENSNGTKNPPNPNPPKPPSPPTR